MKNRIFLIAAIVCLLAGFLAGYLLTPEPSDYPRLSRWTQTRIEKAWEAAGNGKLYWVEPPGGNGDRYYGTYEGYDIFFWGSCESTQTLYSIRIGDFSFHHNCGFGLIAIKSGKVHDLKQIYAEGALGDGELAQIHSIHLQYERYGG
jgi:hypothetical protein